MKGRQELKGRGRERGEERENEGYEGEMEGGKKVRRKGEGGTEGRRDKWG